MAVTKANQQISAVWNRRLTLQLLLRHGTLSRRQISAMTQLRGSTLTYIVRELLDKNILRSAGKRISKTVGQKQQLLEINPDLGWAVGVDLRHGYAHLAMFDAAGQSLGNTRVKISRTLDTIAEEIDQSLGRWLDKIGQPTGRLLGLGVAVPGVVNVEHGHVLLSRAFKAKDVPLKDMLTDRLEAPVLVDHNVNFSAIAEARQGLAQDLTDFVQYQVNHDDDRSRIRFQSFGAALFLGGRLYRGEHFAAGELDWGLGPRSDFEAEPRELEILGQPDAALTENLRELAEAIGASMAHIINFLDPQAIILGGDQPIRNKALMQVLRQSMRSHLIAMPDRQVRIEASTLGEQATAQGAAIAAIEMFLLGDGSHWANGNNGLPHEPVEVPA